VNEGTALDGIPPGATELLREQLAGKNEADQVAVLLDLVRGYAAAVLGFDSPSDLEESGSLLDQGFTSFTALEFVTQLRAAGVALPPSAPFEHPTPIALARYLRELVITEEGSPEPVRS
jgi:polyketide synthase 12